MCRAPSLLIQVYPRAQWPTATQVRGLGAWGGVAAATALFIVQVRMRARTLLQHPPAATTQPHAEAIAWYQACV